MLSLSSLICGNEHLHVLMHMYKYFVVYLLFTTFHDLFAICLFSASSEVTFNQTTYQFAEGGNDMVCLVIQGVDSISAGFGVFLIVNVVLTGVTMDAVAAGIHTQ